MRVNLNLNDEVEFTLTQEGVKQFVLYVTGQVEMLRETDPKVAAHFGARELALVQEGKPITKLLWEVMDIFGVSIHQSSPALFEGNQLVTVDKTSKHTMDYFSRYKNGDPYRWVIQGPDGILSCRRDGMVLQHLNDGSLKYPRLGYDEGWQLVMRKDDKQEGANDGQAVAVVHSEALLHGDGAER